jgi:hypothetical protein
MMRQLPSHEAGALIASLAAVAAAQHRIALREIDAIRAARMGARPATERQTPCPADYGLAAREGGMWGRLRAQGLSDKDAADVVKAARRETAR